MAKKILIFFLLVIVVVGGWWLLSDRERVITNYPSPNQTIVAFGDSLVQGVGASTGSDFVSILSKQIKQPIVNLGVAGNTTSDGQDRIDQVIRLQPKVVLVLLGGNDFLRRVPEAETFANLSQIINQIHNSGAIVVLLGVQGGVLTDKFDDNFEKLAKTHGTAYVPNVLSGLIGNSRLMSDAIHPNDLGYQTIADKILPTLKSVIE